MSATRIFFIGHVSIDKVENLNGSKLQPGGAALYATVAAKTLFDNVILVSIVGKNYPFMDVLNFFPNHYLRFSNSSTRFDIKYNERWEAEYTKTDYGPGPKISAKILPLQEFGSKRFVHISPLPPSRVERIVDAIRKNAFETKISVNT